MLDQRRKRCRYESCLHPDEPLPSRSQYHRDCGKAARKLYKLLNEKRTYEMRKLYWMRYHQEVRKLKQG